MKVEELVQPRSEEELRQDFARDVLKSFSQKPRKISSRYFYDDEGSRLFQKITGLEEYYPTQAEREILEEHSISILNEIGKSEPVSIIELGAGDGHKTRVLLQKASEQGIPVSYYPIDISEKALQLLSEEHIKSLSEIQLYPLHAEYQSALDYIRNKIKGRKLVLFLGSNIGNFPPAEADHFLEDIWLSLGNGDFLLTGFDLAKDPAILLPAYSDSNGVTKDFNLNLLRRINSELGGNFDLQKFRHYATYNPHKSAMESFLISLENQEIRIDYLNRSFRFAENEPLQTECSYKYTSASIHDFADRNGFRQIKNFTDKNLYFADSLWEVIKK